MPFGGDLAIEKWGI